MHGGRDPRRYRRPAGRAGLCGFAANAAGQVRASLVSLACCLSIFLGFGAAIWSQLTIGWQWSESSGGAATAATIVTSAAMLAFLDDTVARLLARGAELLGEVAQYESIFLLCYLRGPAGIIVALAEQIG